MLYVVSQFQSYNSSVAILAVYLQYIGSIERNQRLNIAESYVLLSNYRMHCSNAAFMCNTY